MTDHSERDEAAWAYANGIDNEVWESLSPPEIDFLAFIAGADWAVKNDPRVLKLVKALKKINENKGMTIYNFSEEFMNGANAAFREAADLAAEALTEWSKP